jgi:hypothetical protein
MSNGDPIPGEGNRPPQPDWPTIPQQPQQPQQPQGFGPAYGYPAYGYPQPQSPEPAPAPLTHPARTPEPDWNALADQYQSRNGFWRRWRLALAIGGAFVLGGVACGAVLLGVHGDKKATTTPTASASASGTPLPGQQLADADGAVPLTLGADTSIQPGNGSKALQFASSPDSFAAAPTGVIDTQKSFTVSAWVYNSAKEDGRTAVSQGDGGYYAFDLGRDYWTDHNKWVFKVQTAAGNQDTTSEPVYSKADATVNTWTFLTGTYDATAHTIALYVDGVSQGTTKVTGIWQNDGALQLGRLRYKDAWADHWIGLVSHVETWNVALTPVEVAAAMHNTSTVAPNHAWLVN